MVWEAENHGKAKPPRQETRETRCGVECQHSMGSCAGCGPCEVVFSYSPSFIQTTLFEFLVSCTMLLSFLLLLCMLAMNVATLNSSSTRATRALLPAHHAFLQMVVVVYGCCFIRNLFLPSQNAAGLVGRAVVDSGMQTLVFSYVVTLMYAKRSSRHPFRLCVITSVSSAVVTALALLIMELVLDGDDINSASNVYWAMYDTIFLLTFVCTFLMAVLAKEENFWEKVLIGYLTLSFLLMMVGDFMKIWKSDMGFCIWLTGTGLANSLFPFLCFFAFREDSRLRAERALLLGVTNVSDENLSKVLKHRKWFTEFFDARSPKYSGLGGDAALRSIPVRDLRLEYLVGQGSYGDVYKGTWQGLQVAVKKVNLPEGDSRRADIILQDFVRELQVLTSIRHPNVLNVFGVCPEAKSPAVVTEFMGRGSVFDMLGSHGNPSLLTDDRILSIALDAAKGMLCLHTFQPPILHRDFKSGNLLVDGMWTAKVADFGLSRVKTLFTMTSSIGTVQWMAPEVLKGGKYSERADVYSYGVVLWEMVTKKRPFSMYHPMQLLVLMARQKMTLELPPNNDGSSIHPDFPDLIRSCMLHDPRQRPDFHRIVGTLNAMVAWRIEEGLAADPCLRTTTRMVHPQQQGSPATPASGALEDTGRSASSSSRRIPSKGKEEGRREKRRSRQRRRVLFSPPAAMSGAQGREKGQTSEEDPLQCRPQGVEGSEQTPLLQAVRRQGRGVIEEYHSLPTRTTAPRYSTLSGTTAPLSPPSGRTISEPGSPRPADVDVEEDSGSSELLLP